MDSLKEFLEQSTIHGLVYISNAPSKLSKVFWFLIVVTGFSCAAYLINSSYVDWQSSPIATAISTHPISDLDFPIVTICPPENSNTVLNYDLARARNITLTEIDRQTLINLTKQIFVVKPSFDFVQLTRALLNDENILKLFENEPRYSYPLPFWNTYSDNTLGYEIWSSELTGKYETPKFGKLVSCNESPQNLHFILLLSSSVMESAEDQDVMKIEIGVENDDEWSVQFRKGEKYVHYGGSYKSSQTQGKEWQEAKTFCAESKGHLATIKNIMETKEINPAGKMTKKTWIGGSDIALEGVWTWADGTDWAKHSCADESGNMLERCTRWGPKHPQGFFLFKKNKYIQFFF